MSTPNQTNLTPEEAQKILEAFICTDNKFIDSAKEKAKIRDALQLLSHLSDYQMLGICAETIDRGWLALESYLSALGYKINLDRAAITSVEGPVYIKFNGLRGSYYVDSYGGHYRGVLVSCQSSGDGGINGTYGHLPLDLFVGE